MAARLVILDRDGVINEDSAEFIKSPDEWRPLRGSLEAIGMLSAAGYAIAVATNQSGVGRKLLDRPALEAIHRKMRAAAREHGGDIAKIVFCPHHPDEGCECRKPATGLFDQLARSFGLSLQGVPMIGDSVRDIEAAIAVGGRPILVLTGNGREAATELERRGISVETYDDLGAAAAALIGNDGNA